MSLQNHYRKGYNPRLYIGAASALTKDKAVTNVTVEIDTSQWSSRKKNIIIESLKTNVAACGHEMGDLITALADQLSRKIHTLSTYTGGIRVDDIKPEKRTAMLAYTAAWCRLKIAAQPDDRYGLYLEKHFIRSLEEKSPYTALLPINSALTYNEKRDFFTEYLIASDQGPNERTDAMIAAIQNGETITVNYSK